MGDSYAYAEDLTTTNSGGHGTPLDKCPLTFTANAAQYLVIVTMEMKDSNLTGAAMVRTQIDDVTVDNTAVDSGGTNYSSYGFMKLHSFAAGSHTVKLQLIDANVEPFNYYCYGRYAKVFVIETSRLPEVNSTNPDTFDGTLTFNASAADYLIIASAHTTGAWTIQDSLSNVLASSTGGATQHRQSIIFEKVSLTAGSQTFYVKGSGGSNIWLLAIRLPSDYQYGETETAGTGTRATLTWSPIIGHDIFVLESTQPTENRTFSKGSTELGNTNPAVDPKNFAANGLTKFTADGTSITFTTSGTVTVTRSVIVALDLSALTTAEPKQLVPQSAFVGRFINPQIAFETVAAGMLDVVTSKVNIGAAASIDDFMVRVPDGDGGVRKKITRWEPCWVWMQAEGVVKRFHFRVEEIETIAGNSGNMLELSGRHFYSHVCYRGRISPVTKTNREISDIFKNPTDGLTILAPEVSMTYGVKNVGETLPSWDEDEGRKMIDMFTELSAYASKYTDWRWGLCHGSHDYEWGVPAMHLEKVSSYFTPIEVMVGDQIFVDSGEDSREIVNWHEVEYGPWGATTMATVQDLESQAEKWGISPDYERRVNIAAGQADTLATVRIRGRRSPAKWHVLILPWSLRFVANSRINICRGDYAAPRFSSVSKQTFAFQEDDSGYDYSQLTVILGGLSEPYTPNTTALLAAASRTAAGTSNAFNVDHCYGGIAAIQCGTAVAGGTLTMIMQGSPDAAAWTNLTGGAFTAITTTGNKFVQLPTILPTYIRGTFALTGNFTFSLTTINRVPR